MDESRWITVLDTSWCRRINLYHDSLWSLLVPSVAFSPPVYIFPQTWTLSCLYHHSVLMHTQVHDCTISKLYIPPYTLCWQAVSTMPCIISLSISSVHLYTWRMPQGWNVVWFCWKRFLAKQCSKYCILCTTKTHTDLHNYVYKCNNHVIYIWFVYMKYLYCYEHRPGQCIAWVCPQVLQRKESGASGAGDQGLLGVAKKCQGKQKGY